MRVEKHFHFHWPISFKQMSIQAQPFAHKRSRMVRRLDVDVRENRASRTERASLPASFDRRASLLFLYLRHLLGQAVLDRN